MFRVESVQVSEEFGLLFSKMISLCFKREGGLLFSKRISPCFGGIQAAIWGGIGSGFGRDSSCCLERNQF